MRSTMDAAGWLKVFRALGARAQRIARPLAGTPAGRRSLGRGASGDTTVALDKKLEDIVVAACRRAGGVRLLSEELGVRNFGRPGAWIFLAAISPPRPGAPADIAHRVSSR